MQRRGRNETDLRKVVGSASREHFPWLGCCQVFLGPLISACHVTEPIQTWVGEAETQRQSTTTRRQRSNAGPQRPTVGRNVGREGPQTCDGVWVERVLIALQLLA